MKCYKITEKTGNVIGVKAVGSEDEIMMITTEGIIIRMKVEGISVLGRITSGVKLINLAEDITVASIAKVKEDKSLMPEMDAVDGVESAEYLLDSGEEYAEESTEDSADSAETEEE